MEAKPIKPLSIEPPPSSVPGPPRFCAVSLSWVSKMRRPGSRRFSLAAFLLCTTAGLATQAAADQPVARTGQAGASTALQAPYCSSDAITAPGFHATRVENVAAAAVELKAVGPHGAPSSRARMMPAHCLIQGELERRVGAQGEAYAIKLELRIPDEWNGRLLYQGGGGLNGVVNAAYGQNVSGDSTAPLALQRGYAVVSTDSGHEGRDAAFAADQLARLNFAYAAIGKVATAAKLIVASVRPEPLHRTYFAGCSNGGREAMIAAQRFPELFDGVVAGNPAFHLSHATVLANYSTRLYAGLAQRSGRPLAGVLTDAQWATLQKGVLRDCDALDGASDGIVFDPKACAFDPARVGCDQAPGEGCLSSDEIAVLRAAFAGPRDTDGRDLASFWVWDTGVGAPGWTSWQIAPLRIALIDDTGARYMQDPSISIEDWNALTPEQKLAGAERIGACLLYTSPSPRDS